MDDIEDCWGGLADFPLTDSGRQTAATLAEKLKGSGIELLYTSPLKRAHETATIIARTIGCEIKVVYDLHERNSYGVVTGVNKAKAKEIFGYLLSRLKGKLGDYYGGESIVGDEPVPAFDTRVRSAFDGVFQDASNRKTIGIVTHGNVTRSVYKNILRVPGKIELELLALTVIQLDNDQLRIEHNEGVVVKS